MPEHLARLRLDETRAIFISVDLPEPLRPTRQMRSPGSTWRLAPSSSGFAPKVSLMSSSFRIGGAKASGSGQIIGAGKHDGFSAFQREMHEPAIRDIGNSAGRAESKRKIVQRIAHIADIEPLKGRKAVTENSEAGGRSISIEPGSKGRASSSPDVSVTSRPRSASATA